MEVWGGGGESGGVWVCVSADSVATLNTGAKLSIFHVSATSTESAIVEPGKQNIFAECSCFCSPFLQVHHIKWVFFFI